MVDQAGVDYLVRTILGTGYGGENLDWKINFTGFQVLLNSWQTTGRAGRAATSLAMVWSTSPTSRY